MKRKIFLGGGTLLLAIAGVIATKADSIRTTSRHFFAKTANNACVIILTTGTLSTSRLTTATGAGTQALSVTIGATTGSVYSDSGCSTVLRYAN